jgi:plasmid stability protein
MATLQLRNVPEGVKRSLRKRARDMGETMSEYVLRLIREDLDNPSPTEFQRRLGELWEMAEPPDIPAHVLVEEARRESGRE